MMSVHLSVCLSHAGILSKRLNISSEFFHSQVAAHSSFFGTKRYGTNLTGRDPLTGASNARVVMKQIAIFGSLYLRNDTRQP